MLVSAIHQHEPAVGIHMSPTFWTSLPYPQPSHPARLSQNHSPSSLGHITNSYWLSILDGNVYMFPYDILNLSHPLLPRGEGNGTPLQYSCLENPVDRGAYWAAVHRAAQSRTWLMRLSSSSGSEILTSVHPTWNFKVTTKKKMVFLSHQIGKDVLKVTTPNIIKHFHALMRTTNWSGLWGW